ncbi:DUF7718 family protein [Gordonia sp. DT219]|uniref:DUF7718 family protein n=1 Tax=Gordonia sp. DT219 TaxID=3416658 RepID=UPI003CE91513
MSPRRGQQIAQALRRARKEVASGLDKPAGAYRPPGRDECREKRWVVAVDETNAIRLHYMAWRKGSVLADFVILVERITSGGWVEVERFDCCHGCCHLHADGREASQPIYALNVVEDVQEAFTRASREADDRATIIRRKGE